MYGESGLNPCDASDPFHKTCIAFISTLLGWKNSSHPLGVGQGFLGNVTGFLGGVDKGGVKRPSTQYIDLAGWLCTLANFAHHSGPSAQHPVLALIPLSERPPPCQSQAGTLPCFVSLGLATS
jgi:hypothetical protein